MKACADVRWGAPSRPAVNVHHPPVRVQPRLQGHEEVSKSPFLGNAPVPDRKVYERGLLGAEGSRDGAGIGAVAPKASWLDEVGALRRKHRACVRFVARRCIVSSCWRKIDICA